MKLPTKNTINTGTAVRYTKSSKKSKGTKRSAEKVVTDPNSSDSQEIILKQTFPRHPPRKAHDNDQISPQRLPIIVKHSVNKAQLEKRKQDSSEWKALKKVDHQRLETVLEEGQLSSEETSSKHNFLESGKSDSGSDTDCAFTPVNPQKSWKYCLTSLTDHSEARISEDNPQGNAASLNQQQKFLPPDEGSQSQGSQREIRVTGNSDKRNIEMEESHSGPTESLSRELTQSKRSVILSGMMEILPIFSNDKFVYSRDAISIEEYEDMEFERSGSVTGKTLLEAKSMKDSHVLDIAPFLSTNCIKKEENVEGRFLDRLGFFRDVPERKLRYKVFTDRSVCQQTSSPFINSLLVLTPFSKEAERFTKEKTDRDDADCPRIESLHSALEACKYVMPLKVCFGVVMATMFLFLTLLGIAWKSYSPPGVIDSIIEILPFVYRRRSYLHMFLDKLIMLLSCLCGSPCLTCSCNEISEFSVF